MKCIPLSSSGLKVRTLTKPNKPGPFTCHTSIRWGTDVRIQWKEVRADCVAPRRRTGAWCRRSRTYKQGFLRCVTSSRPFFWLVSGEVTGDYFRNLPVSLLVAESEVCLRWSAGDSSGKGLSCCEISQGYMSQEFIYGLEGELRVLCLFR